MTKRALGLLSLSVTAILLCNEQAAYSSDTLWDLLRKGDPAQKRATPTFPLDSAAPAPQTFASLAPGVAAVGGGALNSAAAPLGGTLWDLLRAGDPAKKRLKPVGPFDAPPPGAQQVASLPRGVLPATPAAPAAHPAVRPPMTGSLWDLMRVGDPAQARSVA